MRPPRERLLPGRPSCAHRSSRPPAWPRADATPDNLDANRAACATAPAAMLMAMRRASSLVQPEKYSALFGCALLDLKNLWIGHRVTPAFAQSRYCAADRPGMEALWASQTCGAWPAHFMAAYSHFGRRYRVVPEIFFWSGCCCAGFETFGVHFPHRTSGVATPTRVSAVQVTFRISQSRDSTDG